MARLWRSYAADVADTDGGDFELTIDSLPVNFTGRRSVATAVNGFVPGPILRWREGDTITLAVTNRLKVPTSIHWHAIRLPADMDGVPGLSFPGIAPGETFLYRIPVVQSGTYWYHSHSRFQEQTGLSGPLIVERRGKDPIESEREYVVFLSDWMDANPETIFSNLKQQGDYYNCGRLTVPNPILNSKKGRPAANDLRSPRLGTDEHISDVSGATYTYLLNGNAPECKLDWTIRTRRTGAGPLHQWRVDDFFRCSPTRPANDRGAGRR